MSTSPELPDPWLYRGTIPRSLSESLESTVGSGLTMGDLDPDVDIERLDPNGYVPRSDRAMQVMGHRWVEIVNVDTDLLVYLRLQHAIATRVVKISAVVYPMDPSREITGSDLRGLPIAARNAAFTRHEQHESARLLIALTLGEDAPDALEKLPTPDASARFAALVAAQYVALEQAHPDKNVAKLMAELNERPLPTVQAWIARARKRGILPPAVPKGRRRG